ncbi:ribosomal RNA small subunit methyltransferase A [Candidatus Kuenenbacteria bacterium]|nr:ribosomal RNA small subunit methyltransferase A [Candidatus Kuenenbacteria bacterium]
MKMNSTKLTKTNLFPKKSLGQNFLVDRNVIGKIIKAADLKKTDNVLEVGPGRGAITYELVERVKKVLAVEKDRALAEQLGENEKCKMQNHNQNIKLKIIEADILKIDFEEIKKEFNGEPYKIVANLPYNITSHFLRRFLEADYRPTEMILMVQREVAKRMIERAPNMNMLAVAVQFFCKPKILFRVSNNCFKPKPRVESAVIRLADIDKNKHNVGQDKFFSVVKQGFGSKRKQLKNNLPGIENILDELGFKPTVRAQELGVEDWVKLVQSLGSKV